MLIMKPVSANIAIITLLLLNLTACSMFAGFFPDKEKLVYPIHPLGLKTDPSEFLQVIKGLSYKEAHRILGQKVREKGENVPPLVNAYMNLSATMKMFGTAMNSHFGEVEETGILVTIADIYETKKERHINTYKK